MTRLSKKAVERLAALGALLAGVCAVGVVHERYEFGVNTTESLSNWAYVVDREDRTPRRGELVQFHPPANPYYPTSAKFVKRVVGVPGDLVEARGREFYVAGRFVGRAKERSRMGDEAPLGPVGVIPAGQYFVVGDHTDSFDSRYAHMGWISAARIQGVARPVL
ncbi:signal peptidase I [Caulobacter sp. 17J65-9]|uniref:signal peptidase I n=1 Tax=Caulobacter sp. 17J65-9 TaxID=2709382 RepID=UPI0013CCE84B|nr:signal peptidase I [Caulobacter sp. 17J65-9]NEX91210.1 signal peptidase I [Caulobacter sp. 17J65-9]